MKFQTYSVMLRLPVNESMLSERVVPAYHGLAMKLLMKIDRLMWVTR